MDRVSTLSALLLYAVAPQTSFKTFNAPQGSKQRVEVQVESGKWKWCLSVSFFLVSNKFQFLQQKREKLFFSFPLPFSLIPCDSLNCRHSDAAADVAVAAGFAVYRTFLAFPLHWGVRLERASRRWQICKFMLWLADRRGNETKQTNFAPKHAQSRHAASESRYSQVACIKWKWKTFAVQRVNLCWKVSRNFPYAFAEDLWASHTQYVPP